jgi:hypothetical protein
MPSYGAMDTLSRPLVAITRAETGVGMPRLLEGLVQTHAEDSPRIRIFVNSTKKQRANPKSLIQVAQPVTGGLLQAE